MTIMLLLLLLNLSSNCKYIQIEDRFISSNNTKPENNLIPSTEMPALGLVLTFLNPEIC